MFSDRHFLIYYVRDTQKQLFAFELQILELIQIRGFNIFWTIDLPLWMVC